ncbi:MAG: hypothetical protein U9R17_17505 [Thermodesulfobacteriota bacterium]|nr:hypothetical protein [Thermodesulfobacteriota bacterium]
MPDKETIQQKIEELEAEKKEREDSLPAHSVRPQQILEIEELESAIEEKKKELEKLKMGE